MTLLKKISILILIITNYSSFAEHDSVYCGTIKKDPSGKALLLLDVGYQIQEGDIWEDKYRDASSRAVIYDVNNVEEVLGFLKKSKKTTVFCAKGRWGGAY